MTWDILPASPLLRGAVAGLVAAAAVDFSAFRAWQSFRDALEYDWRIAAFRWLQGAIVGAVTALGLEVV